MNTLRQRIQTSFDQQRFLKLLGAKLETVDPGNVIISCACRAELTQQQGFPHGGVVTTIADVACGYASLAVIPEGQEALTVEFKINLLRPVTGNTIAAKGTVLKAGKSLVVTETVVMDRESRKAVTKMQATMIPTVSSINSEEPPAETSTALDVKTRLPRWVPPRRHWERCGSPLSPVFVNLPNQQLATRALNSPIFQNGRTTDYKRPRRAFFIISHTQIILFGST